MYYPKQYYPRRYFPRGLCAVWCLLVCLWGTSAVAEDALQAPNIGESEEVHDPVLEAQQIEAWRDYQLSPTDRRTALEEASRDNPFAITPHRPSYLLPITYNGNPNVAAREDLGRRGLTEENMDRIEAKFQISMKAIVWDNILGQDLDLVAAYTQRSFWQVYNSDASRPFRDTNHEPEIFFSWLTDFSLLGMRYRMFDVGVHHQSNGQSDPLSRSWDRVFAQLMWERGNFVMTLRPWYRIREREDIDDNPDIERYMGNGELRFHYYLSNHEFSVTLRNNLRQGDNKGAVQLDWSFPFHNRFRGYIQYFNGYGESMIDYNRSSNRIGIGVMLINWM
jgi:phospholipase A1/A2